MSKLSDAKLKQGYVTRAVSPMCSNCQNLRSDMVTLKTRYGLSYNEEKNVRCALGGFAVKKQATCNAHQFKTDVNS